MYHLLLLTQSRVKVKIPIFCQNVNIFQHAALHIYFNKLDLKYSLSVNESKKL